MTSKLIETLPPTKNLPPMVLFGEGGPCEKGETAAKTGCTPASGDGGKKDSEYEKKLAPLVDKAAEEDPGEAGEIDSDDDALEMPEELAAIEGAAEMFEEKGWDVGEAEVSYELDGGGLAIEIDGEEWAVYPDMAAAESVAIARVKDDIEDDPSMFNQDFVRQYVSWSDTDVRVMANDLADGDLEGAVDNGDVDEDDAEAVNEFLEERNAEHAKALAEDPREYLVDELGFGDDDWFFKTWPNSIDAEKAANAAVDIDGAAHFLSPYDGEQEEAGNSIWYRQN